MKPLRAVAHWLVAFYYALQKFLNTLGPPYLDLEVPRYTAVESTRRKSALLVHVLRELDKSSGHFVCVFELGFSDSQKNDREGGLGATQSASARLEPASRGGHEDFWTPFVARCGQSGVLL